MNKFKQTQLNANLLRTVIQSSLPVDIVSLAPMAARDEDVSPPIKIVVASEHALETAKFLSKLDIPEVAFTWVEGPKDKVTDEFISSGDVATMELTSKLLGAIAKTANIKIKMEPASKTDPIRPEPR